MNRLREFRQRAGLTQTALARRCGISTGCVNKIDLWKAYPKPETQKKIAAVFRVEPKIIFDKPPLPKKQPRPFLPPLPPVPYRPPERRLTIHCRWCQEPISGLIWDTSKYELIISRMPRPAKVHGNGFFYHEDCLNEKLRSEAAFPRPAKK